MREKRFEKGFSLVELLVVVAIIGLLCAIAIPEYLDAQNRAKQKGSVAELRNWGVAISAYMAERGVVPPTLTLVGVPVSTVHGDLVPYAVSALHDEDAWKHPMTAISDPSNPISYTVVSWGKDGGATGCITPAQSFIWQLDTYLSDGIFVCSPS